MTQRGGAVRLIVALLVASCGTPPTPSPATPSPTPSPTVSARPSLGSGGVDAVIDKLLDWTMLTTRRYHSESHTTVVESDVTTQIDTDLDVDGRDVRGSVTKKTGRRTVTFRVVIVDHVTYTQQNDGPWSVADTVYDPAATSPDWLRDAPLVASDALGDVTGVHRLQAGQPFQLAAEYARRFGLPDAAAIVDSLELRVATDGAPEQIDLTMSATASDGTQVSARSTQTVSALVEPFEPIEAPSDANILAIVSSLPLREDTFEGDGVADGLEAATLGLPEIGGWKVEHIGFDDSPADGEESRSRLLDHLIRWAYEPPVIAYVGPVRSDLLAETVPATCSVGLPHISPTETFPLAFKEGTSVPDEASLFDGCTPNHFRLNPRDDRQGQAAVRFALKHDRKRAWLIAEDDLFGDTLSAAFTDEARRAGLKIVGVSRVSAAHPPANALPEMLRRARADFAFVVGFPDSHAERAAVRLHAAQPRLLMLASTASYHDDFLALGDAVTGIHVIRRGLDQTKRPGYARFRRDHDRTNGREPSYWASYGYDAAQLVISALHDVVAARPDIRQSEIRAAILERLVERSATTSVAGELTFDAEGNDRPGTAEVDVVGGTPAAYVVAELVKLD